MKQCRECGQEKPRAEFYRHPRMADGRLNHCKPCKRAYQRRKHHENMADQEWRERERQRSRQKWRAARYLPQTPPEQRTAVWAVNNAVRDGRLVPATSCEDCGHDFSEFRREGHHEDYGAPLDVVWLCALCHGKRHREYVA